MASHRRATKKLKRATRTRRVVRVSHAQSSVTWVTSPVRLTARRGWPTSTAVIERSSVQAEGVLGTLVTPSEALVGADRVHCVFVVNRIRRPLWRSRLTHTSPLLFKTRPCCMVSYTGEWRTCNAHCVLTACTCFSVYADCSS